MPDTDKTQEALALTKWLVSDGPSATAHDLKEAGTRLEDIIMDLFPGHSHAEGMVLREAEVSLSVCLSTIRALLRN
jgi:hypothetical protein